MREPTPDEVIAVIRRYCPKYTVVSKSKSKLHKVLGWLSKPFNKKYNSQTVTTLGFTTYAPDAELEAPWFWITLVHEGFHAIHANRLTRALFEALYVIPAVPLPAPFRAWTEFHGYCGDMAAIFWVAPKDIDEQWIENQLVPEFTGWSYLKMWPFHNHVRMAFQGFLAKLNSGEQLDPYLEDIKQLIAKKG